MTPVPLTADERRAWLLIALLGGATLAGLLATGFHLVWSSALPPFAGAGILHMVGRFYRSLRPDPRLAATCEALAQLVIFTMIAGPLSYLGAALDWPLQDARFDHGDMMMGLDWCRYLALMDSVPTVERILRFAYDTLMPQLAAVLLVLGMSGRLRELRTLVWAAGISGTVTVLVSALLPALGTYTHFGLTHADYPHIDPSAPFTHMADYLGLRDGSDRTVDLVTLKGVITFPSFHAALAALYAWGFWQHPKVRWFGFGFEAMVLAATPIEGGHYFTDVIGGIVITAAAIVAAKRIVALSAGPMASAEAMADVGPAPTLPVQAGT